MRAWPGCTRSCRPSWKATASWSASTSGGLPAFLDAAEPREDLRAYVGTYLQDLQEEIQAEGLTRSIGNFGRFLEVAGLTNGEQINFAAVGGQAHGSPPRLQSH